MEHGEKIKSFFTNRKKGTEPNNAIARKVLRFYYDRGIKIILTNLDTILKSLLSQTIY